MADVYTIQGPTAVDRAASLAGIAPLDAEEIGQVFVARNAAAHLWHGDADLAFDALTSLMALAVPFLDWLGMSLEDWVQEPDLSIVAQELLPPHRSRMRLRATALSRIHNARQEWRALTQRIPHELLRNLAHAEVEPTGLESPVLRICPTGDHLSWFELEWREAEIQDDIPEDEREDEAFLASLECALCGLELDADHFWALGDEVTDRRWVDRD